MSTPQYITDDKGKKLSVVLPIKEYQKILEELDDIRLYDEAKKNDGGKRILFDDYLKKRKKKHA